MSDFQRVVRHSVCTTMFAFNGHIVSALNMKRGDIVVVKSPTICAPIDLFHLSRVNFLIASIPFSPLTFPVKMGKIFPGNH